RVRASSMSPAHSMSGSRRLSATTARTIRPLPSCCGAEFRLRPMLVDAVKVEVGLLVVEAGEPGDLLAFRQRGPVDPDEVLVDRGAGVQGPVAGRALVGAVRLGGRGPEQVQPDVAEREVIARRKAGLEQDPGLAGVGDGHAIDLDPNVP